VASATPGNGRRQQRITAQSFEREHGIVPDVVYINPLHYEQLTRYNPELLRPGANRAWGFDWSSCRPTYWHIPMHPC
jgi:hypothetical protein